MRTTYRYSLEITDRQTVSMPAGALPLSVAASRTLGGMIDVWALVDSNADPSGIEVRIIGTGSPIAEPLGVYLGTCQTHGGQFVWHVFWERV